MALPRADNFGGMPKSDHAVLDELNARPDFEHMEAISMLDIGRNAERLVERLGQGESFRLTYRSRTVGVLRPTLSAEGLASDDPIYSAADSAEPLGGDLDPRAADMLIYGR